MAGNSIISFSILFFKLLSYLRWFMEKKIKRSLRASMKRILIGEQQGFSENFQAFPGACVAEDGGPTEFLFL
jgi:hypothetical protein